MFDGNKKKSLLGLIIAMIAAALVLVGIIGGIMVWRTADKQPAAEEDVSIYTEVDEVLQEKIISESFKNASPDERKLIAQETLADLENAGQIQAGSVRYSESGYYYFNFLSGAEGIIQLGDSDESIAGAENSMLIVDADDVIPDEDESILFDDDITIKFDRIPDVLLDISSPYNEGDKKALIIDGFGYDDDSKNYEEDKKYWSQCHLATTIEKNLTVQRFKTELSEYDFISIQCHGIFDDVNFNEKMAVPMINTGEKFGHDIEKYALDLSSGRVGACYSYKIGSYCIKPEFFTYYYGNDGLSDSIIWVGCCNGFRNDKLVKALSNAGAKAVIGADESVYTIYSDVLCSVFVRNLLCGKDVDQALRSAKEDFYETDEKYGDKKEKKPAEFKLYEDYNSDLVYLFTLTELAKVTLEAGTTEGSVSGTIVSDTGEAVENAEVTIIPEDSALTEQSSVTDSDGSYHINCDSGSYKIRVSADGYESYESEESFSVEARIDTLLDAIELTAEKKALTEEDLKTIVLERSGNKIGVWMYKDYDGNGAMEAYAVIIRGEDSLEDVYFIDSEGNVAEMPADFWGGACSTGTGKYTVCGGKGFFSVDMHNYGSGWQTLLYSVRSGVPYELDISRELQGFYEENGRCYTTENEFAAGGGHSYPEVDLVYDSSTQQFSKGGRAEPEPAEVSWRNVYADYLRYGDYTSLGSGFSGSYISASDAEFVLAYIDNDDVPELLVTGGYSVHIFTCIDGELRHVTDESGESLFSWYGDLEYQQFTGYFIDKYVHRETISNPIYCFENGKAELIKNIECIDAYISGSRVVTYTIDGTEVSEAEYNEVFDSWNIGNGSVWSYAQFYSVTDSNINTYIEG